MMSGNGLACGIAFRCRNIISSERIHGIQQNTGNLDKIMLLRAIGFVVS